MEKRQAQVNTTKKQNKTKTKARSYFKILATLQRKLLKLNKCLCMHVNTPRTFVSHPQNHTM